MVVSKPDVGVLSVEIFKSKNSAGDVTGLMMTVPCRCGLNRADSLRIDGLVMLAMRGVTVLPIDLHPLSVTGRNDLLALSKSGKPLAVAELQAGGIFDSYLLNLVFLGL